MNKISENQNKEGMLKLQYSARYCYNMAEYINYLIWIICILNVILKNILFYSNILGDYLIIVITILMIISGILEVTFCKYTNMGAAYRKLFDYQLFNFKLPNEYNGFKKQNLEKEAIKIQNKDIDAYKKSITSSGTDEGHGVKNWYINIDASLDEYTAIKKCQTQNVYFDKEIVEFIKKILYSILIILLILFVIIFRNFKLIDIIINVCSYFGIIYKVFQLIISLNKLSSYYIDIENMLMLSNSDIVDIQTKIDDRRKLHDVIPNKIYQILSSTLHKNVI